MREKNSKTIIVIFIMALVCMWATNRIMEEKIMDAKYSYSNLTITKGNLKNKDDGSLELFLTVENNASKEVILSKYNVELYSDKDLKKEIFYEHKEREVVIPGGTTGNVVFNISLEEVYDKVYVQIKDLDEKTNSMELNRI